MMTPADKRQLQRDLDDLTAKVELQSTLRSIDVTHHKSVHALLDHAGCFRSPTPKQEK